MPRKDWIRVKDLLVDVLLDSGARWPAKEPVKPVPQPISMTISIPFDITHSAEHDDLNSSINYSALASSVRKLLAGASSFNSLEDIARCIYDFLLISSPFSTLLDEAHLSIVQLRPPLHSIRIILDSSAKQLDSTSWKLDTFRHILEDIDCHAIIGVNQGERLEKQVARVHVSIENHSDIFDLGRFIDTRRLVRRIYKSVGETDFLTLEALTSYTALEILKDLSEQNDVLSPSVTIKTTLHSALKEKMQVNNVFTAAIAFGSNLGDSFQNIETALRLLEAPSKALEGCEGKVDIVNTSFLYKSTPMYVENQPKFINGACMIETNLVPVELLKLLKCIETEVGRVPSIRNGPRAVDLDVIFYDQQVIDTRAHGDRQNLDNLEGHLVVPHPRLCEREFVLRPLNDMIPDFVHPVNRQSISALLSKVPLDDSLRKVTPVPSLPLVDPSIQPVPSTSCHWTFPISYTGKHQTLITSTLLMAIINTTPDSFSDGSDHDTVSSAMLFAQRAVKDGADILDIGGHSTRPGAAFVSVQDEIDRVAPVVSAIRADSQISKTLISVDTFRPEVARAAILAGVNIINDVCAFTGPKCYPYHAEKNDEAEQYMSEMKKIAREYAVPVVLMHSRADAGLNKDYSEYLYAGKDQAVIEGIRIELGRKVKRIVLGPGGVRRWLIMIDPGIGFSKTVDGNLEALRDFSSIAADICVGADRTLRNPLAGYPSLVGASRKSFLGAILAKHGRTTTAKERNFATAATVACAVQQGAVIVRVHDVQEMADVIRVSSGLW